MNAWNIRLAAGATVALGWASAALALPPDTQPGAERLWLKCQVSAAAETSHCRHIQLPMSDAEVPIAKAELAFVDAHPIALPGGDPGSDVNVLARVRISKAPGSGEIQVTAPEDGLPTQAGPELHQPAWTHSPYEFWAGGFVPDRAYREHQPGAATVRCLATASGALVNCWVVSETPAGWAFGDAAVMTLTHARLKAPAVGQPSISGAVFTGTFHFDGKELKWWEK